MPQNKKANRLKRSLVTGSQAFETAEQAAIPSTSQFCRCKRAAWSGLDEWEIKFSNTKHNHHGLGRSRRRKPYLSCSHEPRRSVPHLAGRPGSTGGLTGSRQNGPEGGMPGLYQRGVDGHAAAECAEDSGRTAQEVVGRGKVMRAFSTQLNNSLIT